MSDERLRALEAEAERGAVELLRFRQECVRMGRPELAGFWSGDKVAWRPKRSGAHWAMTSAMWVVCWTLVTEAETVAERVKREARGEPLGARPDRVKLVLSFYPPKKESPPAGYHPYADPEDCVLLESALPK